MSFKNKLSEVETTSSRDKLLMRLLGVKLDRLNELYCGVDGDNGGIELSEGEIRPSDLNERKLRKGIEGSPWTAVSSNTLKMLCSRFGSSYKPDIKYDETCFRSKWKEVTDAEKIIKLSGNEPIIPKQKHYLLSNGYDLLAQTRDLLNWENDRNYLSLVFLLPSNSQENDNPTWNIFQGTMSDECKQIDKYALIVAMQLLKLGDNRDKTCSDLIKNSFMNSDFKKLLTLDYIALTEKLDLTPLLNKPGYSNNEKGKIIQTKVDPKPVKYFKKRVEHNHDDNKRKDLEFLYEGMLLLMANTSGIACKLNIPVTKEFKSKASNESNTWIFGPEYWIHFLTASTIRKDSTAKEKKEGRKMRREALRLIDSDGIPKSAIFHHLPLIKDMKITTTTDQEPLSFSSIKSLEIT